MSKKPISTTVFAPITALGGAVVVIRISGQECAKALNTLGIANASKLLEHPNMLFRVSLMPNGQFLDDAMMVYFKAPNSFTGDNTLEINLHASKFILSAVLELLSTIPGFRCAKNGEFTKIALLNGKVNILQSEGINNLIRAESKQQHRLASELFSGNINHEYHKTREEVIQICAIIESLIDFPDEDIPPEIFSEIASKLKNIKKTFNGYLDNNWKTERVLSGLSIAIAGLPNVGKSSLINCIAKRNVSIVSDFAGTTRDVVAADAEIAGFKVTFFDTAGFNLNTNNKIEIEGIARAKDAVLASDMCIIVMDITEDNADTLNIFQDIINTTSVKKVFVYNKIDIVDYDVSYVEKKINLLKQELIKLNAADMQDAVIVPVSVNDKQNIDTLIDGIAAVLSATLSVEKPMLFNDRHMGIALSIVNILNSIDFNESIELLGEDMRQVANLLGQLTGQVYHDDVLDAIFSKFCIGK